MTNSLLHKILKGFILVIIAELLCFSLKSQIVLPWTEGFERIGTVKTYTSSVDSINGLYDWSFEQSTTGQVKFNSGSGFYHSGISAATLGTSTDGSGDISKLILELDLSLYRNSTDLVLNFYYMDHGDPTSSTDAVYIKSGTSDYVLVYSLIPGLRTDGTYTYVNIDLDQKFADAGLKLGSEVFIKFSVNSKYKTYTTTAQGGITFDDISITGSMPPVLLPWIEDFEGIKDDLTITSNRNNINGRGNISYQKTENGRLRFNAGSDFYHSGSRAATLDCDAYNSLLPNNMLLITLNMSRYIDYNDLELSFSYMQHGEEPQMFDKVFIRGSSSNTWIEAYDLYANRAAAGTWKDVANIDIDALLLGAGQTISSTFQIAFSQVDDYPATTTTGSDGITIDDIKISCMDLYWCGTVNTYFDESLNWWPNTVPNTSSDNYNVIICGDSENPVIIEDNLVHPARFDAKNFIIESGASFISDAYAGSHLNTSNFITIYNDFLNNGTLTTQHTLVTDLTYMRIYGDFINNGIFGNEIGSVSLIGADKSQIKGTKTTSFRSLSIDKSNTDFDAVELICNTDSLQCELLYINVGSLEINSFSVLEVDRLYIAEGACLNVNDNYVKLVIRNALHNDNTTSSTTIGLPSNPNNTIYFDFKDYYNNYLKFGNGTHAGTQLYNVKFLNTAGEIEPKYELRSDMLVQNNLYLDGSIIVADTNEVIIQNTSPHAIQTHSESSYIIGNLRRYVTTGSYDFPVGSNTHYQLATVDISSTSGGLTYLDSRFTASASETPTEGLEVNGSEITEFLDNGYWTITPNTGSAEYDISLTSRGHTNGGYEPAQHAVFKRSGGGDWESLGTHDNGTQTGSGTDPITVKRSSLSGFCDFIIGKNEIPYPLPVDLAMFTAICDNKNVKISWQTQSEINNDYFSLEKSTNGKDFFEIYKVLGCGNCNFINNYEYIDNSEGTNYYRLKQTDFDGTPSYSEIISSNCEQSTNEISCYTSNSGKLCVDFQIPNDRNYQLDLFDSAGKLVFKKDIYNDYNSSYSFDINNLSDGIYYLNIYNKTNSITRKIIFNKF
ncbi:MAG: T9SS type A sorting domain-containing protein [Bacteroidales bacterium]|nr:T9SS type A sorting domain-containing protein [Bacteroidales bacterium]